MHIVLTGDHPFHERGDDHALFKERLAKMRHVKEDSSFSYLASSLFQRLCAVQVAQRYITSEALQHPWITRKNHTEIPQTYYDQILFDEMHQKLHPKIRMMHAIAILSYKRNLNNSFDVEGFQEYKSKIKKISKRIDKWHDKLKIIKEKLIVDDAEYEESKPYNPARFSDLSSSENESDDDF